MIYFKLHQKEVWKLFFKFLGKFKLLFILIMMMHHNWFRVNNFRFHMLSFHMIEFRITIIIESFYIEIVGKILTC
jgi:hypothetical protein